MLRHEGPSQQPHKRKLCDPCPECKRLKRTVKTTPRETGVTGESSSHKDAPTNQSTMDLKTFQCGTRPSQDFEPSPTEVGSGRTETCEVEQEMLSREGVETCSRDEREPKHEKQPVDLFDEAIVLSESTEDFLEEVPDEQCVLEESQNSPKKTTCRIVHKHSARCQLNTKFARSRGVEGLAVVSTGAMSLASHLVDIFPRWRKLRKCAFIHTGILPFTFQVVFSSV